MIFIGVHPSSVFSHTSTLKAKEDRNMSCFSVSCRKASDACFFPFWTSAEKEQSTLIKILQARKARCHLSTHALRVMTCLFCYEEGETSLSVLLFAKLHFLTFSLALFITRDVKLIQTTADRLRGGKQLDTRRYLHFKVSVDSEQSGMAGFWRGGNKRRHLWDTSISAFFYISPVWVKHRRCVVFFRGGNQLRQRF